MHAAQQIRRREGRPLAAFLAALMSVVALVLAPATPALAATDFDYTYEDGSLGFFEWLGADNAVAVIEQSPSMSVVGPYQDLSNMGSEESAFNLDNLERSLDFVEICNQLRSQGHGLSELVIDPYLMAVAQIDVNYSANNIGHAGVYNVGENLAWGYSNPFTGWYYEEKAIYESNPSAPFSEVGHYLNIINGSYGATGTAYSLGSRVYRSCSGQTFYWSASYDGAYTVDEFRAKLAEYRALLNANVSYQVSASSASHGSTWVSVSKASAGTTVTIRLTPDYAYVVDGAPTVRTADGRTVATIPTGASGEYTFVMPAADVTVSAGYTLRFNDVDPDAPGSWYVEAVLWAEANGIMNGYDNGTGNFGPNDVMTRSQLAGVLYNRAGNPDVDRSSLEGYTDVADTWYTDAVAWAIENGVIVGNAGQFRPDDPATREEFVTILWRLEDEPAGAGDLSTFPDGGETSSFAQAAMEWAIGADVIHGNSATGTLDPTDQLTRGMGAGLVMNWMQG